MYLAVTACLHCPATQGWCCAPQVWAYPVHTQAMPVARVTAGGTAACYCCCWCAAACAVAGVASWLRLVQSACAGRRKGTRPAAKGRSLPAAAAAPLLLHCSSHCVASHAQLGLPVCLL